MRFGRAATCALIAGAAAACSLSTSLAGLSGGGPAPDGGSRGLARATPVTDAASLGNDASSTFCTTFAPQPLFCADFDEGSPFDLGWSSTTLTAGGAMAVDTSTGVLRATVPATAATLTASAYLAYSIPTSTHVHYAARLRATQLTGSLTPLSLIQNDGAPDYRGLILYVRPGTATVQEETVASGSLTNVDNDLPTGVTVGQWQDYAFDLDFSGGAVSLVVTVDGKQVLNRPALSYPWTPHDLVLDVGLVFPLTKDAATVELDDIVVDVR